MAGREVEWEEVQGIVLNGYREKRATQYYLLRIKNALAARAWLGNNHHQLSFGNDCSTEKPSLFVAFTFTGLAEVGLPKDALDTFPWDFRDGMTSPLRQRILSDFGPNDPSGWCWGGCDQKNPHILIIAYALDTRMLTACTQQLEQGWGAAFQILEKPLFGQLHDDNREHFGFADGLSQPAIDSSPRSRRLRERDDIDSIIKPGEFILGYLNERGQLPVSPSISFLPDSKLWVITHADRSDAGYPPNTTFPRLDFGRNGSFLVYRQLRQNVFAFAKLLENAANELGDTQTHRLSDEADFHRLIAAKMIGRWDDGTSLALEPNSLSEATQLKTVNNFGYAEEDTYGLRCPIGAHVRRANPRDTRDDDPKLAIIRTKRHRLIRRGRIYGPRTFDGDNGWYAWDTKEKLDDSEERGLHFVAINASIESQFEFVQQTWMNTPIFGDLYERDPLIGTPDVGHKRRFTIQGTPINQRFWWNAPLVTVRGGAYFFLPSCAALKFLASDKLIAALHTKTVNYSKSIGADEQATT